MFIYKNEFPWIYDIDLTASHIIQHSKPYLAGASTPTLMSSGKDWITWLDLYRPNWANDFSQYIMAGCFFCPWDLIWISPLA